MQLFSALESFDRFFGRCSPGKDRAQALHERLAVMVDCRRDHEPSVSDDKLWIGGNLHFKFDVVVKAGIDNDGDRLGHDLQRVRGLLKDAECSFGLAWRESLDGLE